MIENYSRVRLISDKYQDDGASVGAVGYVVEVFENGDYEVEFSKLDGTTYAQITAHREDLAVVDSPATAVAA